MLTDNLILDKINAYIDALPFDRKPQSLYEPIRYVLSIGGKRIRPTLALLAYNLFKNDPESILAPACGLETYHNYTLLHDDLMDMPPCDAENPPYISVGMPTRPSFRATRCWCLPINSWPNAMPRS